MVESDKEDRLYLDDLTVGQRFASTEFELTRERLHEFAAVYDPQPFHLDDNAAKETLFGGLACSGWQTASITMRLIVQSVPFAGGIIGAGGEVSWPQPTRPGDRLNVTSEVVEIIPSRSKPHRGVVKLRSETHNQRNELVQILNATLIVPRRIDAKGESNVA